MNLKNESFQLYQYPILKYFEYKHLPEHLQAISKPYCDIAEDIANNTPDSDEKVIGLRKLLEAKDCIVRAHIGTKPSKGIEDIGKRINEKGTILNSLEDVV